MKLQIRIYISILVISFTTLLTVTTYFINHSHLSNIAREQERSFNEYDYILSSVQNNVDFAASSTDTIKLLLSRYGSFYSEKGVQIIVQQESKILYHNFDAISLSKLQNLFNVSDQTRIAQILPSENAHYFIITGKVTTQPDTVLLYARNIEALYSERSKNIRLTLVFAAFLLLVLSILLFFYSRWLTKPIELLRKGANAISQGDYSIRIPRTKDEFDKVGSSFNLMAQAVEERTNELQQKAKELQEFIDDLSHEMNTPLTSIQGYAEFLKSANATEDQKTKAIDTIGAEAKRMRDIYTKLLSLTLTREQAVEPSHVNTLELFDQIRDTFATQLQLQQVVLETHPKVNTITVDRTLIYVLLTNLIKNSLQALPKGGHIIMQVIENPNSILLSVSDNGIGIPETKLSEVIKPFYRVDKSRSRKTGGAGLGLSICQAIVQAHGATLSIQSKLGEGTTVIINFAKH